MGLGETEMEALWRLSSVYEACTLSACDPVSVPTDTKGLAGKHTFSHMFYDCTDPEERGIETMDQRIREGGDDIQAHLRIHDDLLGNFYSVDEALKTDDRAGLVKAGGLVFENLGEYGKLVEGHSNRLGERAFLQYPTCLPGHFFAPRGTGVIMGKVFNPEQDLGGLTTELAEGTLALENFPLQGNGFGEIRMYEGYDSGEGAFETSFRGRLELTKFLLERADFQILVG